MPAYSVGGKLIEKFGANQGAAVGPGSFQNTSRNVV